MTLTSFAKAVLTGLKVLLQVTSSNDAVGGRLSQREYLSSHSLNTSQTAQAISVVCGINYLSKVNLTACFRRVCPLFRLESRLIAPPLLKPSFCLKLIYSSN